MTRTIRWGIIGTGSIAERFAMGLGELPDAELVAVGSRSTDTAEAFGARFGVPHRHAGYSSLVADPAVDVVYVATPNAFHHDHTLLALEAGKPVLCEKPFALNAAEADEMVAAARGRRLFLMEGMWTRFVPLTVRLREMLSQRAIGDVEYLSAVYGFRGTKPRLFEAALGGGALLDIGVYGVHLASMVFGGPSEVRSLAHWSEPGIDERTAILLGHDRGRLATLFVSITAVIPPYAVLAGTAGRITLHPPFYCPSAMTLSSPNAADQVIEIPFLGNGFAHEAAEVMACVRGGALESAGMPLDESREIMRTMDEIRSLAGRRREE